MQESDREQYIRMLRRTILCEYSAHSDHIDRIRVMGIIDGQYIFDGHVQMFFLRDHPTATVCYAWAYTNKSGQVIVVTVLALPPVDSAQKAVRAAVLKQGSQETVVRNRLRPHSPLRRVNPSGAPEGRAYHNI